MKKMDLLAKAVTLGILLATPVLTYADKPIVNEDKKYDGDTNISMSYQEIGAYGNAIKMNDGNEHTIAVENGKLTITGNPATTNPAVLVSKGSILNLKGDISITNERVQTGATVVKIDNATLNIDTLTLNGSNIGLNVNNATVNGDQLNINLNSNGNGNVYGIKADGTSTIDAVTKVVVNNAKQANGLEIYRIDKITFNKYLELKVIDNEEYAFGIFSKLNKDVSNFNGVKIDVTGAGKSLYYKDTGNVGGYFEHSEAVFKGITEINASGHLKDNHGLYITQGSDNTYDASKVTMETANITASGGEEAVGVEVINSFYKVNNLISNTSGASDENIGILVENGHLEAENVELNVSGSSASGLIIDDNNYNQKHDNTDNTTTIKNLKVLVNSDSDDETDGIYSWSEDGKLIVGNADITVTNTVDENNAYAIRSEFHADMKFEGKVIVNAKNAISAMGTTGNTESNTIDIQKDFISKHEDSVIEARQDGNVFVNSSGLGTVQYSGIVDNNEKNAGIINFNMNNADSYWNLTGDSRLDTLNVANGAKLDMTKELGDDKFSDLHVMSLTGDDASDNIIHMDIDASNNANNSDRIYVDGTHNGVHYITLNNIGANTDGAQDSVLVSVKDEQGEFKANDSEGTLYWNKYTLGSKESADEKYSKDWYLDKVEIVAPGDKPTTSVDTVLSVNSLNYHTWRTENDKLLQRMGELRHNGDEAKGAWFRVKGSKVGYDGGFENKYTTYELGYDEVVKRTENMVRYQGAALSYVDGSSSYNSGSGDNHGKSIGFYSTDQYSKGHYLDIVFKVSNLDNDFDVFDTNGNKITGEYDNTGVSISAEYGRKNDLANGWYIEHQAQLTLGYMGGASYETGNGISVDQSGIKSVLGRIGFNIGKQIGEKGIVYAKANLLHEFGGGYDVEMRAADGSLTVSNTYNDTWFEYGLGVAFATSNNSHVYFDVERSAGSDFYKDWQWNAGMRWSF